MKYRVHQFCSSGSSSKLGEKHFFNVTKIVAKLKNCDQNEKFVAKMTAK